MLRTLLIGGLAALLPAQAFAQAAVVGEPHCTCRAKDKRVELGERLCLQTAEGPRIAICIKNQNLTYWSFTRDGCALSALRSDLAQRASASSSSAFAATQDAPLTRSSFFQNGARVFK